MLKNASDETCDVIIKRPVCVAPRHAKLLVEPERGLVILQNLCPSSPLVVNNVEVAKFCYLHDRDVFWIGTRAFCYRGLFVCSFSCDSSKMNFIVLTGETFCLSACTFSYKIQCTNKIQLAAKSACCTQRIGTSFATQSAYFRYTGCMN